jgi:hypothetical protein
MADALDALPFAWRMVPFTVSVLTPQSLRQEVSAEHTNHAHRRTPALEMVGQWRHVQDFPCRILSLCNSTPLVFSLLAVS